MDQDELDVGRVWEAALDKYCRDAGTDIKRLPQMRWNVSAIMAEQERQVETFNKYRHNKGSVDKFRSAISRNSDVIQAVAKNVANAASSAFPPSAAILTAFTYVMKASKNVSDDYDQVAAFFDIMGSLLERLSLLESKLPTAKNYKTILMRVFSSLMGLCGTATKYVTEGRFKHWLKALYKGSDDDIKADYNTLETNVHNLESATMFATLATVMETKSDVKDLTAISMQSLKVSSQGLTVGIETNTMVRDLSGNQVETLDAVKKIQRFIRKEADKKDSEKEGSKNKVKDSGAKKNAALNQIKTTFATPAEPAIQLKEVETSFVPGTFTWIFQEDSYKTFVEDDSPYLWIYGPPGIGKSCLAYSIIVNLLESTGREPRTSVVYYFFKEEHEELRSAKNMLSAGVIQTAIRDVEYRDQVADDLKRRETDVNDDLGPIWDRFFAEKYPKDSDQKLYMILDGLDEADEEEIDKLLELLKRIKKDGLSIQVIFTSRAVSPVQDKIASLEPLKIEFTKEKISARGGDMWKIIIKRCKTLSKLKRLQKPVIRKIGMKLRLKADSVLYVDHMLRRLNVLGRESLILKELDTLPDDLPKLYELLLSECQKHRSKEQFDALKKLFAWLAYSKRPLTFGEATSLIKVVPGTTSLSLEEEIDGRSARILDLVTDVVDDGSSSEESDSEVSDKHNEEETPSYLDNSITSPLKFQERSMRQYFRAMEVDENGLRSSPSQAHLTIFEMAVRFLNTNQEETESETEPDMSWRLRDYAVTFWMQHFLDIDPVHTPEHEVQTVITSLYTVMDASGEALKNIELYTCDDTKYNIFGAAPYPLRDQFFIRLKLWFERGIKSTPGTFSTEVLNWMQSSTSEIEMITQLARRHISNWFVADQSYKAKLSFEFARSSLQMTSIASGLSKGSTEDETAEADILVVANVFPEIEKTSQALKAIGLAYYAYHIHDAALVQLRECLEITTSNSERCHVLCFIGEIELILSEKADEKERDEHVRKAYDSTNQGLTLYEEEEEVKASAEKRIEKGFLQNYITNRARCEIKLGKLDKAVATIDEAYKVIDDSLDDRFVNEITAELEKREDFEKLITIVEKFKHWDLLSWLGFDYSAERNGTFQHAAWECKKEEFLVKTYEAVIIENDKYNMGAHIRSQLATVYQLVFPNYKEAKRLLFEILDGKKGVKFDDADEDFLFTIRLQTADILMEQFRVTDNPNEKLALCKEMKSLAFQHSLTMASDFNPYESQTAISLALMTGKIGPTNEFQDILEKTFRSCVTVLMDTQAGNDNPGFRQLAKVLAFIPELKRDAQIAYSLQFSTVDESLLDRPKNDGEGNAAEADDDKEKVTNGTNGTIIKPKPEAAERTADSATSVQDVVATPSPQEATETPKTEDLSPYGWAYCNGCSKSFSDWSPGSLYMCIICTDCDLCETCWQKRDRCNRGEERQGWKGFCGEGHKYVRGPVKGWKGVKGGVLRFEGVGEEEEEERAEEIPFKEWMDGLQGRWTGGWKGFWKKEDLVVDIF